MFRGDSIIPPEQSLIHRAESILDNGTEEYTKPKNHYEALTSIFEVLVERYHFGYFELCKMPMPAFWRYLSMLEIRVLKEKEQHEKSMNKNKQTLR